MISSFSTGCISFRRMVEASKSNNSPLIPWSNFFSFAASQKRPNSGFPSHCTRKQPIREYRLVVNVYYVLESSRDNQSMTYLKAHERIRCIRSGRSKKLVEIINNVRQNACTIPCAKRATMRPYNEAIAMTMYAAPQHTPRKRSLSRRTQVFIISALLVPLSLLAIDNIPASAAAKFATLQEVQDAINTALTPIDDAIASLQSTQTTHTSQISDLQTQQASQATAISNLQNSSSKQLKTYDANNQELGIVTTYDGSNDTIYSPTLARFIYLRISDQSFDGTFSPNGSPNYQSNNCTGTPYINADQTSVYNSLFAGPDNFYIVPSSETPTTITTNSVISWDFTHHQFSCCPSPTCTFGPPVTTQVYQLHQVTLPFSVPLALPLQFKYQ